MTVSSSVSGWTARTWQRFATTLRCVSMTPFGRPVVPLEYGSARRSSGSAASGIGASGCAVSRSSNEASPSTRTSCAPASFTRSSKPARRDREPRARVLELEADLVRRVGRVDRREDAAERGHGVEGDGVLGRVRGAQREHVAAPEAALGEAGRDRAHRAHEVGVAQRASGRPVDQRGLVAPRLGVAEHVGGQGDVGHGHVAVRAADDHVGTVPRRHNRSSASAMWCAPSAS